MTMTMTMDNLLIPCPPCQVLGININDLQSNSLQWLKKKNGVHSTKKVIISVYWL